MSNDGNEFIADLIGKPFRDGGRGPDEYDCFGLLEEVYRRRGINLPPEPNSISQEEKAYAIGQAVERGEWELIEKPQPWCAVAFRVIPPYITHVGVVLQDCQRFLHTRQGVNVAVERLNSIVWRSRIAGFYIHV